MSVTMTPAEIIDHIQNDPEYAINFIIDNNPSAVESNISGLSIPLPQDPSNLQMREVIDDLLNDSENTNAPETINEILEVPYLESVNNYTGNLTDELTQLGTENGTLINSPNASGGLIVGAISGILGAVGNVWSGILNNKALGIQQEIINDQQEHELEMLEKTKVFGIPQTIILAFLGFFAVIMILLFMARKK
jgi:hypothetical protein